MMDVPLQALMKKTVYTLAVSLPMSIACFPTREEPARIRTCTRIAKASALFTIFSAKQHKVITLDELNP